MGNCCLPAPDEEPSLPPPLQRMESIDEPIDWDKIIQEHHAKKEPNKPIEQPTEPPQLEITPYIIPRPLLRKNCQRFTILSES